MKRILTLVFLLIIIQSCQRTIETKEINWRTIVEDAKKHVHNVDIDSNDTFDIAYIESTMFVRNVGYKRFLEVLKNPQEDLIIYVNGHVFKIIEE